MRSHIPYILSALAFVACERQVATPTPTPTPTPEEVSPPVPFNEPTTVVPTAPGPQVTPPQTQPPPPQTETPPPTQTTPPAVVQPSAPQVSYIGRVIEQPDGGATIGWSGSTIVVRFFGPTLEAEFADGGVNSIVVSVDGQPPAPTMRLDRGRRFYTIATGLADGEHVASIMRITEALLGETRFYSVKVRDFTTMTVVPLPQKKRIEFIGDSIAAGYGVLGAGPNCGFKSSEEDFRATFGARLVAKFDLEAHVIAASGKGVLTNGDPSDPDTMPILWRRRMLGHPEPWTFNTWVPDIVVVNLGTNDFVGTDVDTTRFGSAYLSFLRDIRQAYPATHIIAVLGPMLSDWYPEGEHQLTEARQAISGAVTTLQHEGDTAVEFFEHEEIQPDEGIGCDYHPNPTTNTRMAADLEPIIARILGVTPQ